MSERMKGNNRGFKKGIKSQLGYKHTEASKIKMSNSQKGKKQSSETIEKRAVKMRGENNYRWIKDRTKLKRDRQKMYDVQYKYWMKSVKNRDYWKCKIGNEDCLGRLEAHHILSWVESPKMRYDVNNGITLCYYHHPRKRAEAKMLAPTFQEMVLRHVNA